MALVVQIDQDLATALKAGDQAKVSVLRLLKSALQNYQIEKRADLSDQDVQKVLQKEANMRKEAIATYQTGARPELADKEAAELAIIETYLPKPLTDQQISALVDQSISEAGASSIADMGKVMGALTAKVAGRADGAKLAQLVRERLAK